VPGLPTHNGTTGSSHQVVGCAASCKANRAEPHGSHDRDLVDGDLAVHDGVIQWRSLGALAALAARPTHSQRRPHPRNHGLQIAHDSRHFNTQHAIPKPPELRISARVGAPPRMTRAIHFNDEPHRRRAEIHDVAPRQRHLPPKLHTQLARAQRRPRRASEGVSAWRFAQAYCSSVSCLRA
jgi:hypothetical protein